MQPSPAHRSAESGARQGTRDPAIDRFRGALVVLMVAGNFGLGVGWVPSWLKHPAGVGFTVADTVAPAFVFAIALTYGPSLRRRRERDGSSAYAHFVVRYLSLIGIGAVISAGSTWVAGEPSGWGVLQALGAAGLIVLPLLRLGASTRAVIGLGGIVAYQYALDRWWLDKVDGAPQGGLLGALSWACLLLLATALADVRQAGLGPYVTWCAGLAVLAIAAVVVVPVSMHRVSLSYVLVTLTIGAAAYLVVQGVTAVLQRPPGLLCWWGENPLVLYLVHLMLLGCFTLVTADWWYAGASPLLSVVQLLVVLGAMSLLARTLHRRGIRVAV